MKRIFKKDFDYMPETYYYPEEKDLIKMKFHNYQLDINNLWLVKPINGRNGGNISFFKSLNKIILKEFVISKYIANISLIKGKKYDLRLYVLVSSLKPLKIYLYKEGLVRIATELYYLNKSYLENRFIHLTNVAINKFSKHFIKPTKSNDENSSTWNIFMYKKFLRNNRIKWNKMKEDIKDIIIKSIISVYQNLTEENEQKNLDDKNFYNMLGFDILINNKFKPILLEINRRPSMIYLNNLDKKIKINLMTDTLNLVGIVPFSRKSKIPLYFTNKYNLLNSNIKNSFCELNRVKGDYELIFPTKTNINKYNKYFIYNTRENKLFWSKIKSVIKE